MNKELLQGIIDTLAAGTKPQVNEADIPQLSKAALSGYDYLSENVLECMVEGLTEADIPTFERALKAMNENELAWLGFKVVYDAQKAVSNTDNEVTKKYGQQGSAHGESMVFFCNDAKEIVCSKEYSPRDLFQMKDVTRGPSMHNQQFDGLIWLSVPLFQRKRVWLLGASDVASELAKLAKHVGFEVVVCDYDPAYLTQERFPDVKRILFSTPNFDDLAKYECVDTDYVCVLTRGHMYDPQSCVWAAKHHAHYIGMMGCKGKNETVHDLLINLGATEEDWERIKRPIGLKFGAKTPAELAIAIVAELIDVRYKENYSEAARTKHDSSIY